MLTIQTTTVLITYMYQSDKVVALNSAFNVLEYCMIFVTIGFTHNTNHVHCNHVINNHCQILTMVVKLDMYLPII